MEWRSTTRRPSRFDDVVKNGSAKNERSIRRSSISQSTGQMARRAMTRGHLRARGLAAALRHDEGGTPASTWAGAYQAGKPPNKRELGPGTPSLGPREENARRPGPRLRPALGNNTDTQPVDRCTVPGYGRGTVDGQGRNHGRARRSKQVLGVRQSELRPPLPGPSGKGVGATAPPNNKWLLADRARMIYNSDERLGGGTKRDAPQGRGESCCFGRVPQGGRPVGSARPARASTGCGASPRTSRRAKRACSSSWRDATRTPRKQGRCKAKGGGIRNIPPLSEVFTDFRPGRTEGPPRGAALFYTTPIKGGGDRKAGVVCSPAAGADRRADLVAGDPGTDGRPLTTRGETLAKVTGLGRDGVEGLQGGHDNRSSPRNSSPPGRGRGLGGGGLRPSACKPPFSPASHP